MNMMRKERVPETFEGIQSISTVEIFDEMQRGLRDRGYLSLDEILRTGISSGCVLEVGPGPGYLGLEWLKSTTGTVLTGLEISPAMIRMAMKNADEYGLVSRAGYVGGNALSMPFQDNSFNAAFSNGSLHEWGDPLAVFMEMERVLKPGGLFCVTDLKRDINPVLFWIMRMCVKPSAIRQGFTSSVRASYTRHELGNILKETPFTRVEVMVSPFGLAATGTKRS